MHLRRTLAVAALSFVATLSSGTAQTLTMGVRAGPESIDPHFSALGVHAEALKHIYDPLVKSDNELQLQPGLATSWTPVSENIWEFKLREGVTFHDGSAFDAEDVKFSVERIPDVTGPNPATLYTRQIVETRIVDPMTIHFVTDGPAPTLPNDLVRLFIVSSDAAEGLDRETANAAFNSGDAATGTGPYKYVSWTPRVELVLERNDDYWGGAEPWEQVIRKEIANDASRVAQLRSGQVDIISRVPATDIAALQAADGINVETSGTVFVFQLDFDMRDESPQISAKDGSPLDKNPFQDPRVREAIDLAIDREVLSQIAMEGMGEPANQIVPASTFGYNDTIETTSADVERAKELLAEAGYPDGFKFTLSFTVDRLPGDRDVGTSLAQMLARIGIEAEANGVPVSILFSSRARGDLSATMAGWGTITGEAYYTYSAVAHSNDPDKRLGQFNWRGYKNEELDAKIEAAKTELDAETRRGLLSDAAAIFSADRATLPLVTIKYGWAHWDDRVTVERLRADEETLAMDVVPAGE
ncbi:ABC transporter substrate-binding protein [Pseudooceanicola sp.]|uniref:ABC transporter substrate-binding protein n=1 Tax=Pseudooceanicola sp. TaxID=1914328 RepID=UPI00405A0D81